MGTIFTVEALAWIAASPQQHERAAVLLGVATGLWQSLGTTPDSHQSAIYLLWTRAGRGQQKMHLNRQPSC